MQRPTGFDAMQTSRCRLYAFELLGAAKHQQALLTDPSLHLSSRQFKALTDRRQNQSTCLKIASKEQRKHRQRYHRGHVARVTPRKHEHNLELWLKFMAGLGFAVRVRVNPLMDIGNCSATSNNMKLAHWPLMGGLLHLVLREGNWAGPQPDQVPPRCTKCNSPPINGQ